MSYGYSSLTSPQDTFRRPLYSDLYDKVSVKLIYDDDEDVTHDLTTCLSRSTPIHRVIDYLLRQMRPSDMSSEDVTFVSYSQYGLNYNALSIDRNKTLSELRISDGSALYFRPSFRCQLTVFGPAGMPSEHVLYDRRSTTLQLLLVHIIKSRSLQSIARERIHLFHRDEELNLVSNGEILLKNLEIPNNASIDVQIVEKGSSPVDRDDDKIHVRCSCDNKTMNVDVPSTNTISQLRRRMLDLFPGHDRIKFYSDSQHRREIDSNDSQTSLKKCGVKPGDTIYVTLSLDIEENRRSSQAGPSDTSARSLVIAEEDRDTVDVRCDVSGLKSFVITASLQSTVGELIKRLAELRPAGNVSEFEIRCGSINIDESRSGKRLADLGIWAEDVIDARLIDDIASHSAVVTRPAATSATLERSLGTDLFNGKPVGLDNLGNTCFMNSVLQCLVHARPLTHFILSRVRRTTPTADPYRGTEWNPLYSVGEVSGAYAGLLQQMCEQSKDSWYTYSLRPARLKETIDHRVQRYSKWDQEDAQEFMTSFLDEIQKEFKEKGSADSSNIIDELFFGTIQSTVTCLACAHEETTTNPISFLPLPVNAPERTFHITFNPRDGREERIQVDVPIKGQVKDLVTAFRRAYRLSTYFYDIFVTIDGKPFDYETPLRNVAQSEVTLVERENYLRSDRFSPMDTVATKTKMTLQECLEDFCIPEQLEDLRLCPQKSCAKSVVATKQLCLSSLPPVLVIQFKRFSHRDGFRRKIETFVEYPRDGLNLSGFLSSEEKTEAIYDLFAVTNHMGTINSGHYTAYIRRQIDGRDQWFKVDDSYVTSVYDEEQIVSRDAYLLFYLRRSKST